MLEEIFFDRCLTWWDHVKLSSTKTPKILSFEIILRVLLLILRLRLSLLSLCRFWFVVTSMTFVFEELRIMPLALHHMCRLFNAAWRFFSICSMESCTSYKVVSSAYRSVKTLLVYSGRSLIKSKNKSGPNIDPWGTPHEICLNPTILWICKQWRLWQDLAASLEERSGSVR